MIPRRSWFVVVLLVTLLAACGSKQRTDTLKASIVAVNALRDAAHAWDLKHQDKLIDSAKQRRLTKAEVTAELDTYLQALKPVLEMFTEVYMYISFAATEDDDASFVAALKAVANLRAAITNFQKLHEGSP